MWGGGGGEWKRPKKITLSKLLCHMYIFAPVFLLDSYFQKYSSCLVLSNQSKQPKKVKTHVGASRFHQYLEHDSSRSAGHNSIMNQCN